MEAFSCAYHHEGRSVVLVIRGELDVCTAGRVESVLSLLPPTDLVIDCAGIRFIDSFGLRPLERAARRCSEMGTAFALRQMPRTMTRVIDLIGLTELMSSGSVSTAGRPVTTGGTHHRPAVDRSTHRHVSNRSPHRHR